MVYKYFSIKSRSSASVYKQNKIYVINRYNTIKLILIKYDIIYIRQIIYYM